MERPIDKVLHILKDLDRRIRRLQTDLESVKKAINQLQEQKRICEDLPVEEKVISAGWFFS